VDLSCRDHNALEYCWFRHPSGYHLRFSTEMVLLEGLLESSPPRSYVYDDTLHLGVCAVRVSNANVSVDWGEWTCHLGVPGIPGEDHSVPITVRVSGKSEIAIMSQRKSSARNSTFLTHAESESASSRDNHIATLQRRIKWCCKFCRGNVYLYTGLQLPFKCFIGWS
jgi:hypothetical protein